MGGTISNPTIHFTSFLPTDHGGRRPNGISLADWAFFNGCRAFCHQRAQARSLARKITLRYKTSFPSHMPHPSVLIFLPEAPMMEGTPWGDPLRGVSQRLSFTPPTHPLLPNRPSAVAGSASSAENSTTTRPNIIHPSVHATIPLETYGTRDNQSHPNGTPETSVHLGISVPCLPFFLRRGILYLFHFMHHPHSSRSQLTLLL